MSEPQVKKTKTVSALDQLKAMTTIVADTGDFEGIHINFNLDDTFIHLLFPSNFSMFTCAYVCIHRHNQTVS